MSALPRIAVIGYGAMGKHHSRNLASIDDAAFAGIMDSSEAARAEAEKLGFPSFASIEELLKTPLDAAIVAVPTTFHHRIAMQLLEAGIPLLVEKPIADTLEHGRELIDLAHKKNVPLMVGYVERFNPAILVAQRMLHEGVIGKPLQICTRRVGTLPFRVKDANVIVDIGVHDIDIVSFLLGADVRLISAQGGMSSIADRVDYATLSLDAGGVAASTIINWLTPVKVRDLTITGSRGYLQVDYLRQQAHLAPGRDFVPTGSYETLVAQYEEGTLLECPVERHEPLRLQLEKFVAALGGGDYPDPAIALQSLRIALEATDIIQHAAHAENLV